MPGALFLQTDWLDHLGPLYLSAFLKSRGITTDIIITRSAKRLIKEVGRTRPEIVAVSLSSAGHRIALDLLQEAKAELKIPVILGGPHPTFFPEVLASPAVDFIIRGEAEESFYRLILALRQDHDFAQVSGLGYKKDGELKFNPAGKLDENLDRIPFPDRSLYVRYKYYRRVQVQRVITCRGCPYNCSYCFNASLKDFYRDSGKYVRQRSAQNVIAELKAIMPQTRTVNFADDSFGLDRVFADEFLGRYGKEIRLPFIVNLRPEQVSQDYAQKLAKAGCYSAQIGIEAGNDELRERLLDRKVNKDEIRSSVRYLQDQGIKVLSYNMLGLPGETLEQGFETIRFNRELKVEFPRVSIFQPYPGTELGKEMVRKGWANDQELFNNLSGTYFNKSVLKMPQIRELENLQKLFAPAIRSAALEPLIKQLIKLPGNPFYEIVFLISIAAQYQKATNRSLRETIEYGFKNLALYFQ